MHEPFTNANEYNMANYIHMKIMDLVIIIYIVMNDIFKQKKSVNLWDKVI